MKILKEEKLKTTFKKPTEMGKKLQRSLKTNMRIKGVNSMEYIKEGFNQPDYQYYIFNTKTKKIESGWEYKEDALEVMKDNEMDKKIYKVLSGKFLTSKGFNPKDDKNWGVVEETTTASSSGSYETKYAWSKSKDGSKFAKKPIYKGGFIVESIEDAIKSYKYFINVNEKYINQIDDNPELKDDEDIIEMYNEKKQQINDYQDKINELMEKIKNISENKNLKESTDQDKYENVVFLQGEEAEEPLQILKEKGEDAALEYLKQWHDPGNHEGDDKLNHGTNDDVYEKDNYIMSYNDSLGYIGLQYEFEDDELDESIDVLTEKYEQMIQESPIEYQRLYRSLLKRMGAKKVKDLNPRQKKRFFSNLKTAWKSLKEKLKMMQKTINPIEMAKEDGMENMEENKIMIPEGYEKMFNTVMREMGYSPDQFDKMSKEEKRKLFDTLDSRWVSDKEEKYMTEHHAHTREEMIDFLVKASKFIKNPVTPETFENWGDADIEVMYYDVEDLLRSQGELENVMAMEETTSAGGGASGQYTANLQMKENKKLTEKAPPGMEDFIKDAKPSFKKQYGDDWKEVLYSTAWERYNKKNESVNEDKKPATELERDRIHSDNKNNFKKDLKNYGSIHSDIDKSIKKPDEYVNVTMNSDGDAFKDENIKKFHPTSKLEKDIMLNRGKGMEDLDYDIEPTKDIEERMKEDQKEKYEQGKEKKKYRKNQPMYNKDAQPVIDEEKYEKENEKNESIYGIYLNNNNKRFIIEFDMKSVKKINESDFKVDDYVKLNLDGIGNSYNNKIKLKENFVKELKEFNFYLNKETDEIVKIKQTINESENDNLKKMKHLFNYNPKSFLK
ncbi:MAG: hypothetical protein ACOC33_00440 [bacterium]